MKSISLGFVTNSSTVVTSVAVDLCKPVTEFLETKEALVLFDKLYNFVEEKQSKLSHFMFAVGGPITDPDNTLLYLAHIEVSNHINNWQRILNQLKEEFVEFLEAFESDTINAIYVFQENP